PCRDKSAAAVLGMAIARLLAAPAESYLLQNRNVVLDYRSLAHDQSGGVIEEDAASDAHGGIDVGLEDRRRPTLEIVSKILAAPAPQPVRKAMGLNRVKAFEVQDRLKKPIGCGIAIDRPHNVP